MYLINNANVRQINYKRNNIMAKLSKTVRISQEAVDALKKLCEKHNRSEGNMIEVLILEAAKDIKKGK